MENNHHSGSATDKRCKCCRRIIFYWMLHGLCLECLMYEERTVIPEPFLAEFVNQ